MTATLLAPEIPWLMEAHGTWCSRRTQAIKNRPPNRPGRSRDSMHDLGSALTGTPVENRLGDLWSIFGPFSISRVAGLGETVYAVFPNACEDRTHNPYGPLRELVRPTFCAGLKRIRRSSPTYRKRPGQAFCQLSRKPGGALSGCRRRAWPRDSRRLRHSAPREWYCRS